MKCLVVSSVILVLIFSQIVLYAQEGAEKDELEMLKQAWKRHRQDKEDENPEGQDSELNDPLGAVEGKMKSVERRLTREDTGGKTQEKQREVLELLDELIEQAEDAERPPDSEGGGTPEEQPEPGPGEQAPEPQPLIDPSKPHEPAQPGSSVKKKILRKTEREKTVRIPGRGGKLEDRWGEMQPAEKLKALEQPMTENFPPKYELLLRNYFRQLLK
jgi:hypothetical protein